MRAEKVEFGEAADTAKRLDQIGWGVFLVMIGTIWLVPSVPEGTWLIGSGVLLLILNAVRVGLGVKWSGVSVALGVFALAAGLADLTGVKLPLFAICLIVVGASLIVKPLISQRA
jgi:hypothetical protein